jgi:hypothetical protein
MCVHAPQHASTARLAVVAESWLAAFVVFFSRSSPWADNGISHHQSVASATYDGNICGHCSLLDHHRPHTPSVSLLHTIQ